MDRTTSDTIIAGDGTSRDVTPTLTICGSLYKRRTASTIKFVGAACSLALGGILVQRAFYHQVQDQTQVDAEAVLSVRTLTVQGKCHEAVRQLMATPSLVTRNAGLHEIGTAEQCDFQTRLAAFQGIDDDGRIGEIAAANLITMHIHRRMWAEAVAVIQAKVKGAAAKDKHIQAIYAEMSSEVVALCRKGNFEAANGLIKTVSSEPTLVNLLTSLVSHYSPKQPCEGEKIAQPQAVDNGNEAVSVVLKVPARQEARTNAFEDPEILRQLVQVQLRKGPDFFDQAFNIAKKAPAGVRDSLLKDIALQLLGNEQPERFAAIVAEMTSADTFIKTIFANLGQKELSALSNRVKLTTQEGRMAVLQALLNHDDLKSVVDYILSWTSPADQTEGWIAYAKYAAGKDWHVAVGIALEFMNEHSEALNVLTEVINQRIKIRDYQFCGSVLSSYFQSCKSKSFDTALMAPLIFNVLQEVLQNSDLHTASIGVLSIKSVDYDIVYSLNSLLQHIGKPWADKATVLLYEAELSNRQYLSFLPDRFDELSLSAKQQCTLLAVKKAFQMGHQRMAFFPYRLIAEWLAWDPTDEAKDKMLAIPGVDLPLEYYILQYQPHNSLSELIAALHRVNRELGRDTLYAMINVSVPYANRIQMELLYPKVIQGNGYLLSDVKEQFIAFLSTYPDPPVANDIDAGIEMAKKVYLAGGDDAVIMNAIDDAIKSNKKGRMGLSSMARVASAVIKDSHIHDLIMTKLFVEYMNTSSVSEFYEGPATISGLIKDPVLAEFAVECLHKVWKVDTTYVQYGSKLNFINSLIVDSARAEWVIARLENPSLIKPYSTRNRVLDPAFHVLHTATQQHLRTR